jgi:probable phosphoglycerate mutase
MRIYLVRHGETSGDIENRYGGDYEDHLTTNGIIQSEELARKLEAKGIAAIYSSPMIRALETAGLVGEVTGLEVNVIDGLAERNHYGVLTGMVKQEAKRLHPEHVAELEKGRLHKLKGSENYEPFKKRVLAAFKEVTDEGLSPIALVAHGGVIRCIVREIAKSGELEEIGDCSIITIEKEGKKVSVEAVDGAVLMQG